MTAVRRSTGTRPGGTDGEGKRDDHENTLPLVGRVSGQVRLYEERGRGVIRETGTARIERELERSLKQARYPGDDWQRDKILTSIAGGRRLLRALQESRGNSSVH